MFWLSNKNNNFQLPTLIWQPETSYNIEIVYVVRVEILQFTKVNNKGTDQTVRMHRLVCTFVVCMHLTQVF